MPCLVDPFSFSVTGTLEPTTLRPLLSDGRPVEYAPMPVERVLFTFLTVTHT